MGLSQSLLLALIKKNKGDTTPQEKTFLWGQKCKNCENQKGQIVFTTKLLFVIIRYQCKLSDCKKNWHANVQMGINRICWLFKRRHQLSRPRHLTLILLTVHKVVIYIYRPIWQNNCTWISPIQQRHLDNHSYEIRFQFAFHQNIGHIFCLIILKSHLTVTAIKLKKNIILRSNPGVFLCRGQNKEIWHNYVFKRFATHSLKETNFPQNGIYWHCHNVNTSEIGKSNNSKVKFVFIDIRMF